MRQLSPVERRDLARHERIVARGLAAFCAVGRALLEIRRRRLWEGDYADWDDYLRRRWQLGRSYAGRLQAGSGVVLLLARECPGLPLPQREAQVRPLAGLPPVTQAEVWRQGVESAGGAQPATARLAELANRALAGLDDETRNLVLEEKVHRAPVPAPVSVAAASARKLATAKKLLAKATRGTATGFGDEAVHVLAALGRAADLLHDLRV